MSDVLTMARPTTKAKKRGGKVRSVLRVLRDGRWIGDVLLDRKGRVWRRVEAIPPDVVMKAVAAFTRGEANGEMIGRRDALAYAWYEVVEEPAKVVAEPVLELAEVA